ncbi:MAG: hypothetical protein WAW92_04160 [Minisyncoccia bacterium]
MKTFEASFTVRFATKDDDAKEVVRSLTTTALLNAFVRISGVISAEVVNVTVEDDKREVIAQA